MNALIFSEKETKSDNASDVIDKQENTGPIRSSVIVLTTQIIIPLLFTDIIYALLSYFFLRVHFLNLGLPLNLDHYSLAILTIIHILKTLIQIYFVVQIVLKWAGYTYYIVDEHLIKREGIFTITEKSYDLKNIRTVAIHQSLIGKIFHYGDVVAETSASGGYMENVTLIGVADPQKYERKLLHNI